MDLPILDWSNELLQLIETLDLPPDSHFRLELSHPRNLIPGYGNPNRSWEPPKGGGIQNFERESEVYPTVTYCNDLVWCSYGGAQVVKDLNKVTDFEARRALPA